MEPCELRTIRRIADLIREAMQERGARYEDVPVARETLRRVFGERQYGIRVTTLARLADALGYEVVINLKARTVSSAQDMRKEGAR